MAKKKKKKVADVVIESLIAAGVKRVYGISGDSLNGTTDSIREHDKDISWVHVRHEGLQHSRLEQKLMLQEILLSVLAVVAQETRIWLTDSTIAIVTGYQFWQ